MQLLVQHTTDHASFYRQSDRPDHRSDQQNGENNIESNGAEGITHDAVNNEARVTAPEMKRNQAYARGMTHGQM